MTKKDIITAAFRVWGRDLYLSTSLSTLAAELGVTKAALYRHFKNKQALLNGMYEYFFDDYGAFIKEDYCRAINAGDPGEGFFIIVRIITEYYLRNMDFFIFVLVKVYGNRETGTMVEYLRGRGIDMMKLRYIEEKLSCSGGKERYPPMAQMILVTLTFWVACFHRSRYPECAEGFPLRELPRWEVPPEPEIQEMIASVEKRIAEGLGYGKNRVEAIDYEKLENLLARIVLEPIEEDTLLRAVAGAVAEAGPWNASMDMVARRSGLSKSGLYAHFRNKQDMLRRLFHTEFERMILYAEGAVKHSAVPEEQLYLAIIAIADYLRSRPEILAAVDWLRTRRLNLGLQVHPRIYRLFLDLKVPGAEPGEIVQISEQAAQWVLFLIVNVLMRRPEGTDIQTVSNASFHLMYRFVALGLGGFNR